MTLEGSPAHLSAGLFSAALQSAAALLQLEPTDENLAKLLEIGRTAGPQESLRLAAPIGSRQSAKVQQRWGLAFAAYEREALQNPPAALRRLEALFSTDPEDEASFEAYVEALREVSPVRAAELLGQRAEAEEPSRALSFSLRAAELWQQLAQPAKAKLSLLSLLERAPELGALRGAAARLLAEEGPSDALIELLSAGLLRLEGEERAQAHLQLSRVYDAAGDPARALATLEDGLDAVADDPLLSEALLARYEQAQRWGDYVQLALSAAARLPWGDARRRLEAKAALILEEPLGEPAAAAQLLSGLVAGGARGALLEALERSYRKLEAWPELLAAISLRTEAARSSARADAFADRAALYAEQGQQAEAEVDLRRALEAQSDHPQALDRIAELEAERGQLEVAAGRWLQLVPQLEGGARAGVLVKLGRAEVKLGRRAEAKATFDQAMRSDPERVEAVLGRLDLAEEDGDATLAHDLGSAAAALSTGVAAGDCWRRAGDAARSMQQEKAAIDAYLAALEANPQDAVAEASLGRAYAKNKLLAPALAHLSEAAAANPDEEQAAALFLEAAQAALGLGRPEEAAALAERGLLQVPLHRETLDWLSELMAAQLRWAESFELSAALLLHHEGALKQPKRAQVYLRMSRSMLQQGFLDRAESFAKAASAAAPQAPEPWLRLAGLYQQEEQLADAVEALERVAERAEASLARDALVRAGALQLRLSESKASRAEVRLLSAAQRVAPADVSVAERLMQAHLRFEDRAQAAEAVARTARRLTGPEKGELLYLAARLLQLVGEERRLAKGLLTEAAQAAPELPAISEDLQVLYAADGEWEALIELRARITAPPERVRAARLKNLATLHSVLKDPARALAVSRQITADAQSQPSDLELQAELLEELAMHTGGEALLPEASQAWAQQLATHPGDFSALDSLAKLSAAWGHTQLHRLAVELANRLGQSLSVPPPAAAPEAQAIGLLFVSPSEAAPDTELLDMVGYALWAAVESELPEYLRPRRTDRLKNWVMADALSAAADSIGLKVPPVFTREDALAAVQPTVSGGVAGLVISQRMCGQLDPAELRHQLAVSLSCLRQRAVALVSLPIELVREALVGMAKPEDYGPYGLDPRSARRRGKAVERALPSGQRAAAQALARAWLADPNRRSLTEARRAVQETAARAGLLSSGSLRVSCGVESQRAAQDPEVSPLALCRFACSQDYLDKLLALAAA